LDHLGHLKVAATLGSTLACKMQALPPSRSRGEAAVLAAMEEERLAIVAGHAFDFADEDGVIAGGMFRDEIAGEMGQRPFQQRNTALCPLKTDAQLLLDFGSLFAFREMLGEGLLAFAENADAKAALRFEERQKASIVGHANEDQKRLERDRSEGVGGHAMNAAGFAFDGDDGDAGGESARDTTEKGRIEG